MDRNLIHEILQGVENLEERAVIDISNVTPPDLDTLRCAIGRVRKQLDDFLGRIYDIELCMPENNINTWTLISDCNVELRDSERKFLEFILSPDEARVECNIDDLIPAFWPKSSERGAPEDVLLSRLRSYASGINTKFAPHQIGAIEYHSHSKSFVFKKQRIRTPQLQHYSGPRSAGQ